MPIPSVILPQSLREKILAMTSHAELFEYIKAHNEVTLHVACTALTLTPEALARESLPNMTPYEAAGRIIEHAAAEVKAIIQLYKTSHP